MKRKSYQQGSLTQEKRKDGSVVWIYRWRTKDATGKVIRPKQTIGNKSQFPSKSDAWRAVEGLRMDVNREVDQSGEGLRTIGEVYAHYEHVEMGETSSKRRRTKEVIRHNFRAYVGPRWSGVRLRDVKPIEVERWLSTFSLAPSSKQKIKGVMSVLFEHAIRYEWARFNPIRSVRQSGEPLKEFPAFEPEEVVRLLNELDDPAYTATLIAATTGMRRGEIFGLKWIDIDFERKQINVVRAVVDQIVGVPKTRASRRPLPLPKQLASALLAWREKSMYPSQEDWVFASPTARGTLPLWPDAVLKRHLYPAALRAGVEKPFSWHTFRRTFATLLDHSRAPVKTTQELMRHASPQLTYGLYAKGVDKDKREASEMITDLFSGSKPQR